MESREYSVEYRDSSVECREHESKREDSVGYKRGE